MQVLFIWTRYNSLYIYINTIGVIKNHHCRSWHNTGPQGSPLLSTNVRASSLYGIIVASLRIKRIYIKIYKIKIKSYPQQNHTYVFLFFNCFHSQEQPNSSQSNILYVDLFCLSNNRTWNKVFQVFMKT